MLVTRILKPELLTPETLARKVYDAYAGDSFPWALLSPIQRQKLITAAALALDRLVSDGILGE